MIQPLQKSWCWNKLNKAILTISIFLIAEIVHAQMPLSDVIIPGGSFDMGDHFGFVDHNHPSDEIPIHFVDENSPYTSNEEIFNG